MPDIVFVFEAHQPYRLNKDIPILFLKKTLEGKISWRELEEIIFDHGLNEYVFKRAAQRCYLPATRILIEESNRLKEVGVEFKFSLSMSGVFIEQARKWAPGVIDLIVEGVSSGVLELIEQTYYHSLVSLHPEKDEFIEQLTMHHDLVKEIAGVEPKVVENTEFIYNNDLACFLEI